MPIFMRSPPRPRPRRSRRASRSGGRVASSVSTAPVELVAEPGLLPLGVLPRADGDGLGHRLARPLPVQVLHRLADPDPVESRRVRRGALRPAPRHLLDQAAPHHLLRPPRDPLVQHRPGHGEHNVPRVDACPRARAACCQCESGCPVSSATSMARAARWRPPPAKAGIEPAGPAQQLERLEPGGAGVERAAPAPGRAPARGTVPRPAPGCRARCRPPPPAAGRGRGSSASQPSASRAKCPAL